MNLWRRNKKGLHEEGASRGIFSRLWTELIERLRLRRGRGDTSEDDEGLPRSPCNSPTATEKTANKDHPAKSHSTCSEGSLISMGSSEMDENSSGQQSHHSSKVSLQDKRSSDGDLELESFQSSLYPLNHSAAHHRVSVRPSRRHGAPRRRRAQQISTTALPTTLEVNEESSLRSVTPEITIRASPNADSNKLHRSRSNAGTKSQDEIGTLGEEDEPHDKKGDSFLGKLFPIRRSGKRKRQSKEEKVKEEKGRDAREREDVTDTIPAVRVSSPINIERKPPLDVHHPKPFPRSGAATRQRMIPNDIPPSPELSPRCEEFILPKSSPEKSNIPSPLHLELESRLQQRMASQSASTSSRSPPNTPESPTKSPIMEKHFIKHSKVEVHERKSIEATTDTNKNKVVIAGLSQFQKKTITHHSDEKDYKSLTDFSKEEDKSKPVVVKSHSFKSIKNSNQSDKSTEIISKEFHNISDKSEITKASSSESIKNLDIVATEKQNKTEVIDIKVKTENKFVDSGITISGPSHKAIVSVGNGSNSIDNNNINMKISEELMREEFKNEEFKNSEFKTTEFKEHQQLSVTKIQVKRESTHVIKTSSAIPEFMNIQLHKVEKPNSNVVLSTAFSRTEESKPRSPTIVDSCIENFGIEIEKSNKTEHVASSSTKMEYETCEKSKIHVESSRTQIENQKIAIENPEVPNLKIQNEIPKILYEDLKTQNENSKVHLENSRKEKSSVQIKEHPRIDVERNKDDGTKHTIQKEHLRLENEKLTEKLRNENEKHKLQSERFKSSNEKSKLQNGKPNPQVEKSKIEIEKSSALDTEKCYRETEKCKVESKKCDTETQKLKTGTPNSKQEKLDRSISVFEKLKIDSEKTKIKMERSISEPETATPEMDRSKDRSKSETETEKSRTESVRKFSKEDIEIIEKDDVDDRKHVTTALVTITTMTAAQKAFKKPDNLPVRKSFLPTNTDKLEKPVLKVKSSSLDMVEIKAEKDDKSSLKSDEKVELRPKTHSANDITDQVMYRRKSIINQKKEDEPELMKVFARRSLKLKDSESEALSQQVVKMIEEEKEAAKSRDSDKENQNESPPEERKKKFDPEVTLRKPVVNNKIASSYQRAVSLNQKANEVNTEKLQKQYSLAERPKTEWIKPQDEIITITDKGTFIEEDKPKNFNQRMAEWEKRAQSVRKTSP